MNTWKKAFSNPLIGPLSLLVLISTAPSTFALPVPLPLGDRANEEIRMDEAQDYQKLVKKIAVYGGEGRRYTNAEYTRATMRLFCMPEGAEMREDGTAEVFLLGSANLTGPKRLSLASHTVTPTDNCKVFRDLSKCYAQDTTSGYFFKMKAETVQGKPGCATSLKEVSEDEVKIEIEDSPRGVEPYKVGDPSQLEVGEEVTVIGNQSYNFDGGNSSKSDRIIQTCEILKVETRKKRIRTNCDTGVGYSGSVLLNHRREAVGILSADVNIGDKKIRPAKFKGLELNPDGLEADVNTNYSIFTMITDRLPSKVVRKRN